MALLANEVMDESASVYLNDASKTRWTFAVLLPYLRSAWLELQSDLEDNDLPPLHEQSAIITIPANTTELTAAPADMVLPIEIKERLAGESYWIPVNETGWEPDIDRTNRLRYWTYREGKIQFLGATGPVDVMLRYVRNLSAISSENTVIEVGNAKGYLAARTAGLAATFGGSASERGNAANQRADYFKNRIIGSLIKRQGPVRRRRYPFRRS